MKEERLIGLAAHAMLLAIPAILAGLVVGLAVGERAGSAVAGLLILLLFGARAGVFLFSERLSDALAAKQDRDYRDSWVTLPSSRFWGSVHALWFCAFAGLLIVYGVTGLSS